MKYTTIYILCFYFFMSNGCLGQTTLLSNSPENNYVLEFMEGGDWYNYLVVINPDNGVVEDSIFMVDGKVAIVDFYAPSLDTMVCIYQQTYASSDEGFFYMMYTYDYNTGFYNGTHPVELVRYDISPLYKTGPLTVVVGGKKIVLEEGRINSKYRTNFHLMDFYKVGYMQYDYKKGSSTEKVADMRTDVKNDRGPRLPID